MSGRPSAERLAFLREQLRLNPGVRELFTEIDAVTRERNIAQMLAKGRERERDEALKVTDEMVERAARAMFEGANLGAGWNTLIEGMRQMYRISARRALTAALGGDK